MVNFLPEIEALRNKILNCRKCDICKTRNHVIFGEGNLHAGILLIGEAPGRDEDIQGRPFVGLSGQLLDKILAACGFTRDKHVFKIGRASCRERV